MLKLQDLKKIFVFEKYFYKEYFSNYELYLVLIFLENYINIIWKIKIKNKIPNNVSWIKLDIKSINIKYRSINKSNKIDHRINS